MAATTLLDIDDLGVRSLRNDRSTIRVSLTLGPGEFHALVAPANTSTDVLASALMGGPHHVVTSGCVRYRGDDITDWATDVRAKVGLFLFFGDPAVLPDLGAAEVLRSALSAKRGRGAGASDTRRSMAEWSERLGLDSNPQDAINTQILQMALLEPELVIIDGGCLDTGELVRCGEALRVIQQDRPELAALWLVTESAKIGRLDLTCVHQVSDHRLVSDRDETDKDA